MRGGAAGSEVVVPVVRGGAEALDLGVAGDHEAGGVLAGVVGVEAAADCSAGGEDLASIVPNYIRRSDAEIGFMGKKGTRD